MSGGPREFARSDALRNGLAVAATGPMRAARRRSWACSAAFTGLLALAACGPEPVSPNAVPADGWHEFRGSLNASGTRRALSLGEKRGAALVDLSGSLLLTGPSRPALGFRAEGIALSDSATGLVGRAVWTDDKGERLYSEIRGEGTATGLRVNGTFIGGTGRYAGATGTYEFVWQYVLYTDDGTVQGRATDLAGRVRFERERSK